MQERVFFMKKILTIIVTCYNEEDALPAFYEVMSETIANFKYDIETQLLFIDDGSKDNTLQIIKAFAAQNKLVHYVSFSRNFGKEAAIYAGLLHAKGDYISVIDADLQHPPYLLEKMLEAIIDENFDVGAARRVSRKGEPAIRSAFARYFYKIINKLSDVEMVDGATDFRIMKRQVATAILQLQEVNRYSKGIFSWVGFKTKWIEFENTERIAGETKWSFWKLVQYAIEAIVAFSTAPLIFSAVLGIILFLFSIIFTFIVFMKTLLYGDPVAGFPTLVIILTFIGGIQLFFMGIVGRYLASIYLEVKKRPIFISKDSNCDS